VLIIQADEYNRSRLNTVIVAALTSNTSLAAMPGNVFIPSVTSGLPKDSVANVTALATIDRRALDVHAVGHVPDHLMSEVDDGIRRVLALR
jgi:mRNA interferase MazF